jgi:hypothetical protein
LRRLAERAYAREGWVVGQWEKSGRGETMSREEWGTISVKWE